MPEYEVLAIAANSVKELSEKLNEHAKNGWLLFSFSSLMMLLLLLLTER